MTQKKLYTDDPVLVEIEKFMKENENITTGKLILNKGRIYDSTTDLLDILDSDSTRTRENMPLRKCHFSECELPLKKRKLEKTKPVKRNMKKVEQKKREVLRPRKICFATMKQYKPRFFCCKDMEMEKRKKRRAKVKYIDEILKKAILSSVTCRDDACTLRNITVKKEIIDLTEDEESCFMLLKFAKECLVEAFEYVDVPVLVLLEEAKEIQVPENELNHASSSTPNVRISSSINCIDLTSDSEEDEVVTVSEKECANEILPYLYKYHKIFYLNNSIEQLLRHFQQQCPEDEEVEYDTFPCKLWAQRSLSLGYDFVSLLSNMFMKNLCMDRFLGIVISKFVERYHFDLDMPQVVWYIYEMLTRNQEHCKSGLPKQMLEAIGTYFRRVQMKHEEADGSVVFTEEQLKELREQIEKYHEIVRRHEGLMCMDEGSPVDLKGKEMKKEMLNEST